MISFGQNLVTVADMAKQFDCSEETIRRAIRVGKIHTIQKSDPGRAGYLIDMDEEINRDFKKGKQEKIEKQNKSAVSSLSKEECQMLKNYFVAMQSMCTNGINICNKISKE